MKLKEREANFTPTKIALSSRVHTFNYMPLTSGLYSVWLTPITSMGVSSLAGAEMTTRLAPRNAPK